VQRYDELRIASFYVKNKIYMSSLVFPLHKMATLSQVICLYEHNGL